MMKKAMIWFLTAFTLTLSACVDEKQAKQSSRDNEAINPVMGEEVRSEAVDLRTGEHYKRVGQGYIDPKTGEYYQSQ